MPTVLQFPSGDTIRFGITFEIASVATDPTTVTFRTKNPNGTVRSFVYLTDDEVVKVGTGIYRIDLALNLVGEHHIRWEGTGDAPGVTEDRVLITASNVIM